MNTERLVIYLSCAIIAVFIFSCLSLKAFALTPEINIAVLKYEPYPAEPGKYFDLWINIENAGLAEARQFSFELKPSYPFSIDLNENSTRYFGSIAASSNAFVKYVVRVAPDAVQGWNRLEYRYKTSGGLWVSGNLSIYVRASDSSVNIEKTQTFPDQIAPGQKGELEIAIKNMGSSVIKDVTVKLDLSSLSMYSVGAATEKKLYLIQPGETSTFSFNLLAGPELDAGAYRIPVNVSYYDWTGTRFSKTDYATIIVGDAPQISVGIEKSEIYSAGQRGTVTFKIINTGLTGVKLLSIAISNAAGYDILSPSSELYIGKIDSDGYETAEFEIYVHPDQQGNLVLPIKINYRDDNNNRFYEERSITLKLYNADEIARYGFSVGGGIPSYAIVLVLVVVGYFAYKRFMGKKPRR